jgi:hypothetical protein
VALAVLLLAPSALAHRRDPPAGTSTKIGAGVGAAPLVLPAPAHPGHTYRFPPLYVVNTGTQTSSYLVRVDRLAGATGHIVPTSWVRLERTRLRLGARQSAFVPVMLILPKRVGAGAYRTDLVVGTSTRREQR